MDIDISVFGTLSIRGGLISKTKKNIYIAIQKNDCGPLQYYLGRKIEYDRTKDTTKLNQKNHNEKTLEKFSLKESQVADMFTKSLDASKFIYTHK